MLRRCVPGRKVASEPGQYSDSCSSSQRRQGIGESASRTRNLRTSRYNVRMARFAILIMLVLPAFALGGGGELDAVQQRYLPAVQAAYANTPDGAQARYDAGRDLVEAVVAVGPVGAGSRALRADLLARGRAQVARAEALDRDDGFRSTGPLAPLPRSHLGVGPRRPDATLARRLAAAASTANGAVGIWVHELATGRYAGSPSGGALRGRVDGEARRARRWAAGLAAGRAQQLVVRRAADRLLVVEPGREPAALPARLRGGRGRPATPRDDIQHLSRPLPRDDRVAPAGPAHACRPRRGIWAVRCTASHAGAHGDARALGLLGLTQPQAAAGAPRARVLAARR